MCSDYLTFKFHCSVITVAVKFRVDQRPLKFRITREANCFVVNFLSNTKSMLGSSFPDFAQVYFADGTFGTSLYTLLAEL